jgi:hypothetical protein
MESLEKVSLKPGFVLRMSFLHAVNIRIPERRRRNPDRAAAVKGLILNKGFNVKFALSYVMAKIENNFNDDYSHYGNPLIWIDFGFGLQFQ